MVKLCRNSTALFALVAVIMLVSPGISNAASGPIKGSGGGGVIPTVSLCSFGDYLAFFNINGDETPTASG
jgi:hypothetical protein